MAKTKDSEDPPMEEEMRLRESASEKEVDSDVESLNCCQLNVHKAKIRESRSKYHNHPQKRLFHRRSCTDVVCFLIFLGCLAGWIYLGYFAIKATPPDVILAPTDSRNRRCGFDEGVRNKPNVFYFDLLKCVPPRANVLQCDTPRVCVAECPKENFYLKAFMDSTSLNTLKSKMICQEGFNKADIYNKEAAYRAVENRYCAEWYLESKPNHLADAMGAPGERPRDFWKFYLTFSSSPVYRRCLYNRLEVYEPYPPETYFNKSASNETMLTDFHVISDIFLSYFLCLVSNRTKVHEVFSVCSLLLLLVGNRCLPKSLRNSADEVKIAFESFGQRIESTINGVTGKQLIDASKGIADIIEFGHVVFEDLRVIWPWILVHVCLAAIISFIYITIMRWISGLMVWLSIFTSIGLLLYSCVYTFNKFKEISESESVGLMRYTGEDFIVLELLWKKETWLAFFIISIVVLLIILITIVFLRSRISLAIELIKEGSKAVISSWSAVIFPIFPWLIQVAVVAYAVVIFAYLMNAGVPVKKVVGLNGSMECVCDNGYQEGSVCDDKTFNENCHSTKIKGPCTTASCLYSETATQKQALYLQLYNLLMFLWSLFFASGFGQMVLASTFATYYWTFNKDDLPVFMVASGVWRVMRYHLGTVSLGSFLLALCNWIRILLEVWYNYLNKYDNSFVKFLKCCCSCVFWCLNSFLKFLNKNAYIMCAIHGKNFCSSARLAFNLLVRNILRVAVLDRVTNFLFFLGKVMVTSGLGLLSFHFFSNPLPPLHDPFKGEKYTVEYFFVPMTIVCIVTYFITSLFFGVYSMAVDTLFLCALEDLETNDGSPEKPYFMSKNLMKILKKKNEIKVNK